MMRTLLGQQAVLNNGKDFEYNARKNDGRGQAGERIQFRPAA